jgi:hypothetical protein
MDSIAYAYAAMTATPAQAPNAAPMQVRVPVMTGNAAARIKGQISPTPVNTFQGVWSPPPRREPL